MSLSHVEIIDPCILEAFQESTFEGCIPLNQIEILSSIKSIKKCAFKWCIS